MQLLVITVGTLNEIALWPAENINNQPKKTREKDQDHPAYRVVHTSCFRITCNPHQERDVENEDDYGYGDKCPTTSAPGEPGGGIGGIVIGIGVLSESKKGTKTNQSRACQTL